jgi:hypothetical protein
MKLSNRVSTSFLPQGIPGAPGSPGIPATVNGTPGRAGRPGEKVSHVSICSFSVIDRMYAVSMPDCNANPTHHNTKTVKYIYTVIETLWIRWTICKVFC